MYLEHFGLTDQPFRLTSDPRFLYLSESHARVKAYIEYATHIEDSFVIFTGEIGSGKTTLIQDAISRMPEDIIVAKNTSKPYLHSRRPWSLTLMMLELLNI